VSSVEGGDAGLGAWLRKNVEDRRVRGVLAVVVALILIGIFALKAFSGPFAALQILAVEVCFVYAVLLIFVASVAVWPLDQGASRERANAARRAQANARGNLLLLATIALVVTLFAVNVVAPIWPALVFEAAYQRYRWHISTLSQFFDETTFANSNHDDFVSDMRDPGALVEDGRIGDVRGLLQLVSRTAAISISTADYSGFRHTAVIAARKIVFDAQSAVRLGKTNLLIVAEDIEVKAIPKNGAAIFAYRPDEAPPPEGDDGGNGRNAGTITLVILGKFGAGSQPLKVDLRGERGGTGSDGRQPGPDPGNDALDYQDKQGEPESKIGQPSDDYLDTSIQNIKRLLKDNNLDEKSIANLGQAITTLEQCKGQKCTMVYCLPPEKWENGLDGKVGAQGGVGGRGGAPGEAGRLEVYRLASDTENDKDFADHFQWLGLDGGNVSSEPPPAAPGKGGQGGAGGVGGKGGLGSGPDPLGVCRRGVQGGQGKYGPIGPNGKGGPTKDPGPPARIGILQGL
jgi:hypothetical protein